MATKEEKDKPKDAKPAPAPAELTEEDKQLKEDLELLVQRLKDPDSSLHHAALEALRTHIRSATSTMTSVPKPLKFLRPHWDDIKEAYENMMRDEDKALAADILSVMSTTRESSDRPCLKYRLLGSGSPLESWGHEYVRHLQGEIAEEYAALEGPVSEAIVSIAAEIVPYCMKHNAEAEACDLLMEIERLDMLAPHVDEKSYERVCLYLFSCVPYVAEPEDTLLLETCYALYSRFKQYPQAMQMALRLNDGNRIRETIVQCTDRDVRRQIAFMLARHQYFVDLDGLIDADDTEIEILKSLMSNSRLSESFQTLARELDIMEPKTPDDIYKTNTEPTRGAVDSARANLASAFVNAFVNAGFGSDKLLLGGGGSSQWIHKHKDMGVFSATASIGMLLLWDVDGGLSQIDAYMLSAQDNVRAGALLAVGIVSSGVRNECDPALALLADFTMHQTPCLRIGACMGLGLAYAGSANESVSELLLPVLEDSSASLEIIAVAALALGQIFVGSANGTITEALVTVLLTRELTDQETHVRVIMLALGLLYLGKQAAAEVTLMTLGTLPAPHNSIASTIVEICAYAGTGNLLKIQKLLHVCSAPSESENAKSEAAPASSANNNGKDSKDSKEKDKKEKEKETKAKVSDMNQAFSVLGIALIALGEEIGTDMALRSFNHLLHYGDQSVRRAVPVALALLFVSNPHLSVLDTLSKLSHDSDPEVAHAAIAAMGLVSAGTNQARVAGMLRTLAQYYAKDANALFMVRVAQGLLHTGKGSITLSPLHTERTLVSPVALSGLLSTLTAVMDSHNVLLRNGHFMLYHLALAMHPRILCTFDTSLAPLSVPVRVGQAVDVVAQAGRPKTITGFVTSTTPVLLGYGERAQLATDQYLPLTPLLEGFVILTKNPEYEKSAQRLLQYILL